MAIIDGVNPDKTKRIYDKFYNFDVVVNASEYDVIHSYFFDLTKSADVADNFTVMVFRIANLTDTQAMEVFAELKTSRNSLEVNAMMAYYLNNMRNSATLLGLAQPTQPNFYAVRNIRP